ncbi:apolipoprotein N-acyltransferase [Candidatus Electrothrix sp.]|uniref:apolipoprotein N-acyltransferase n=1 Tax=Candidatus Electrothrix sp. TaxID=2170559 RepID=UPI00405625F5
MTTTSTSTASTLEPLNGYSPYIRALLSAVLLTLAMPGITGWWPLLFIALIPLFSALGRLSIQQSLFTGLLCGLLYYTSLLYWIIAVLKRYGGFHPALAAAALFALAFYMTVYFSLFCVLANHMLAQSASRGKSVALLLLIAPTLWIGLDFLRGILFTGIPWMDLGYALYRQPLLIQAADLGGHHLISFAVILVNALLFWLADRIHAFFSSASAGSDYHFAPPVIVFLLLVCLGGYSTVRYQQISSDTAATDTAIISVVQGNIEQHLKWSPHHKEKTVDQYLSLSAHAFQEEDKPALLVWPETALPFYPAREPLMDKIRDFIQAHDVLLLTGSPYFIVTPQEQTPVSYYNSALLLDHSGRVYSRYNKQHLVPFGEYVPLRTYLWFIKPLVEIVGDFTPGDSFKPLVAENIKAGVLICFESIFPDIARQETTEGANLLVNLTNDAWYGESSAPYHSWAMTVFRAVENRRGLVRAANTGISGFVSPTGEILQETALFKALATNAKMPLLSHHTLFTCGGYRFAILCLTLIPTLLYFSARKKRKE